MVTNAWDLLELVMTIWPGIQARSLALVAFGLDSVVEVFASTVVIWNLRDNRHVLPGAGQAQHGPCLG